MTSIRVGSFNCHSDGLPSAEVHADLIKVLTGCDVLGLQEAAGVSLLLAGWFPDWGVYVPPGPRSARQTPIMWRKGACEVIHQDTRFGTGHGLRKHDLPPTRYISIVRLKLRAGARHLPVVLNTHFDSHVERHGVPIPLPRQALYRHQMKQLTHQLKIRPHSGCVIVTSDTNVNQKYDKGTVPWWPRRALGLHRMRSNWRVLGFTRHGTHGTRFIDCVFLRSTNATAFVSQRVVTDLHSDHNALVVTIRCD